MSYSTRRWSKAYTPVHKIGRLIKGMLPELEVQIWRPSAPAAIAPPGMKCGPGAIKAPMTVPEPVFFHREAMMPEQANKKNRGRWLLTLQGSCGHIPASKNTQDSRNITLLHVERSA